MTLTLNRETYLQLLNSVSMIPKSIETEAEYEDYLAIAEQLLAKRDQRTPEETALFRLLVKLVEDYEEQAYSLDDWGDLAPYEILQHLLESSGQKQADLINVISPSKGLISSIVNGKRSISKDQAKKLGTYFHVSPSLFF